MIDKIAVPGAQPANTRDPARIRDAAQQFETLLVAQMLKTAREATDGGWMGSGEDQTAESAMGIAEESLARSMVLGGGLGLTKSVVAGLSKASGRGDTPAAPAPPPTPAPSR